MNQHLTWDQISDHLIGGNAPQQARHALVCGSCRSELRRLESALLDFRGAVRQWTGRKRRPDFQTSTVMDTGAGEHLNRLLTPASLELPWYQSLVASVASALHPRKLPPLDLTSKPVDSRELKGLNGLYAGNEASAGIGSLIVHTAMIALLLFLGSLKPLPNPRLEPVTLFAPPAPLRVVKSKSGGGGGARQLEVKTVEPPKVQPRQFTPPHEEAFQTKIELGPSILNAPDISPVAIGNLTGLTAMNGPGHDGGFGNGPGGGIGGDKGPGMGTGPTGRSNPGINRSGNGVTNPIAIYKPEPQYSEEARKAKWQGSVLISLHIDEDGKPNDIKVIRALGLGLDEKAIEAVQQWKFKPGTVGGKPVKVQAQIEVTFRLL